MQSRSAAARLRQVLALALLGGTFAGALALTRGATLEPADFTFNNGTEVQSLDPAAVTGVPEGRVVRALFEGLVVKHPKTLEPLPGSADRWEVSEDGLVYTFHIREDGRWTNGDPLTAHDFEYSFERFLHPATGAYYAYQLWYVRGAKEYTRLPQDRTYDPREGGGLWLSVPEPAGDGRLRVRAGVTGYALGEVDPGAAVELAADGEHAADAPLVRLGERGLGLPLAARVVGRRAGAQATAEDLRLEPYALEADGDTPEGWLLELELDALAWQDALAEDRLLPGPRFRQEVVRPRHLGLRCLDDRTLEVTLESPTPFFIDLVGFYPTFPVNRRNLEEARERWPETWEIEWLRPENIVTNGPYRVGMRRVNDRIRLVKNETYWDADEVAFETIDVLAVEQDSTMLNLYLTGACDYIDRVNTGVVHELMPREDFTPEPYLGTYYFRVNTTKPPLDDPRVRRALALTIPRKEICESVMKMGQIPSYGFVPPNIPGYTNAEMPHADGSGPLDVAEARALLEEAGFGDDNPFPILEIHYNTSEAHASIAQVIALAWQKQLGIRTKLRNEEWKVYLDTQQSLRFDVSRSAWIGDYADPNTFSDLMVTGGENNRTGWGDPEYDRLVAAAARELDPERRMELLHEAEVILVRELPVLPVYSYVTQNIVAPRLGGFHENVLDEHFPKFWYWMDDAELAARRAADPRGVEVDPHGPPEGLYSPAEQARRAAR